MAVLLREVLVGELVHNVGVPHDALFILLWDDALLGGLREFDLGLFLEHRVVLLEVEPFDRIILDKTVLLLRVLGHSLLLPGAIFNVSPLLDRLVGQSFPRPLPLLLLFLLSLPLLV